MLPQPVRLVAMAVFAAATVLLLLRGAYVPAAITLIACVAYAGMHSVAPSSASSPHATAHEPRRRILQFRYADWAVTTPLILALLLARQRMSGPQITFVVVADVLMVVCGYLGKCEPDARKRAMWFSLGMALFLPVAWALLKAADGSRAAATISLCVWSAYPMVWVLSDLRKITVATEDNATAVLDVVAKVGVGLLL
jgi:sensory rhodopsin